MLIKIRVVEGPDVWIDAGLVAMVSAGYGKDGSPLIGVCAIAIKGAEGPVLARESADDIAARINESILGRIEDRR